MNIPTLHESARGCGFRKPGGLYLVADKPNEPCPRLPFETHSCPTCGAGIKPARGFTWVDGATFLPPEHHGSIGHNLVCPLAPDGDGSSRLGRCGLIWVGGSFYPTPESFMREAVEMGVSRRIHRLPRGFEIGETWVLLGHRDAVVKPCPECADDVDPECPTCDDGFVKTSGVITAFRPTAVEYVVRGDESAEELGKMSERGISPVRVVPVQTTIEQEEEETS